LACGQGPATVGTDAGAGAATAYCMPGAPCPPGGSAIGPGQAPPGQVPPAQPPPGQVPPGQLPSGQLPSGQTPPGQVPIGIPPLPSCTLDTHAVVHFNGRLVETITHRGRLSTFESDGTPWPANGMDLTSVPYYAQGPCAGRVPGRCTFDTRSYLLDRDRFLEYITAYGVHWVFDNGSLVARDGLTSIPRYSDVCAASTDGVCVFDTRTFVKLDSANVESVTAYGRLYEYTLDGTRSADNGKDLTTFPHYAGGPCSGKSLGQCKFDTRTFGVMNNAIVEVVTAYGLVWRFGASSQGPIALPPSGVPTRTQVPFNKGPCE
jgi:hypothetical protein